MSERAAFRGRGGGRNHHHPHTPRGGASSGQRGAAHAAASSGAGGAASGTAGGRAKRESIVDLAKYMDKEVCVRFSGGREVTGVLKGYDQLMNLVLDDVKEVMRDDEGNQTQRSLGLVVARGTLLVLLSPADGSEEIANPFAPTDE